MSSSLLQKSADKCYKLLFIFLMSLPQKAGHSHEAQKRGEHVLFACMFHKVINLFTQLEQSVVNTF